MGQNDINVPRKAWYVHVASHRPSSKYNLCWSYKITHATLITDKPDRLWEKIVWNYPHNGHNEGHCGCLFQTKLLSLFAIRGVRECHWLRVIHFFMCGCYIVGDRAIFDFQSPTFNHLPSGEKLGGDSWGDKGLLYRSRSKNKPPSLPLQENTNRSEGLAEEAGKVCCSANIFSPRVPF